MITSENTRKDVILAGEIGVDRYILKPFSTKTFIKKIRGLIKNILEPDPLGVKLRTAEEYLYLKDLEKAESLLRQAQQLSPKSARVALGLAKIYASRQKYLYAQQLVNKAIQYHPKHVALHLFLLEIYDATGNQAELLRQARNVHWLSPNHPRYTLLLASLLAREGQFDQAELYFKKSLGLSKELAHASNSARDTQIPNAEIRQPKQNLKKTVKITGEDLALITALGRYLISSGHHKAGIEKLQMSICLNPNNEKAYFYLGQAYEDQRKEPEARESYAKAIAIAPEYQKAIKALTKIKSNNTKSPKLASFREDSVQSASILL